VRKLLLREPRRSVARNMNVVLLSNNPRAEFCFVIMEATEYPAMSGSNTIYVATVLLEKGMAPMREPQPGYTAEVFTVGREGF